ncbi:Uncharacterised protein [Vibrio cholerae]|nr:Uncharacterised protein [Vibrio cholerae]
MSKVKVRSASLPTCRPTSPCGMSVGFFCTALTTPPGGASPYKIEAGPFSTSIRSKA